MSKPHWLNLITSRKQTGPVHLPDDIEPKLPALPGIRAVVFDVYGTLFSSGVGDISLATEENRDLAIRQTLEANSIEILAKASNCRLDDILHAKIHRHQDTRRELGIEFPEVDIRHVWADFLRQLANEQLIGLSKAPSSETLAIDYETRVNPTQPMPALAETLAKLANFGPMSIISNAQFYTPLLFEAYLEADISSLGFRDSCNVWSYAMLEGKPSQVLYTEAAAKLKAEEGLEPDQCLYVGNDMRNDIWPAQAIGFKTALFAGDRLSLRLREDHPACRDLSADAIITSLAQLPDLVGA